MNYTVGDFKQKLDQLIEQARLWEQGAIAHNLFKAEQKEADSGNDEKTSADLFAATEHRPLVIALFGGTGVGKSTLLNRFAGQDIARTGIERPTSREVTIYVHQSIEIKHLPDDFPVQKVSIRQHQDDTKRDIMWIDMPDIDSIETVNLEMVRDWIPYIDVLLYVVSPERYRDDRGWRYLLEHGYRHGWLFVINQWDQGDVSILDDFASLLSRAGFDQPLIFRTDCLAQQDDDFAKLQRTLFEIANEHTISELARHGLLSRLKKLKVKIDRQTVQLGRRELFHDLEVYYEKIWLQTRQDLEKYLALSMQQLAAHFMRPATSILSGSGILNLKTDTATLPDKDLNTNDIWDQRAQTSLLDLLNKIVQQADNLPLPVKPIRTRFAELEPGIKERMAINMENSLRQALANPGGRLHRMAYRLLGILMTVLPLAALAWVAWRVVSVYYGGGADTYLGINFAIHSLLLVLVAWFIPYFLHKKLQPSLQKAAIRGLRAGLEDGLAEIAEQIRHILNQVKELHNGFLATGEQLLAACDAISPEKPGIASPELVKMLQKELHTGDSPPKL